MNKISVTIRVKSKDLMPTYASYEAAGADLRANVENNIIIQPGKIALIPTGIFLEIPSGFEAQVRPRSGLALNNQISVLNTPGTIDADYRGEIKVILVNHGSEAFTILPKMRIAQLVFAPVVQACFYEEQELASTSRGENGFGSSGLH